MTDIEDHALAVAIEERVRELWRYRAWWRANRWADWPQVRHDLETELRSLVRLWRKARKLAKAAGSPDSRRKKASCVSCGQPCMKLGGLCLICFDLSLGTPTERFWTKVKTGATVDECWLWEGSRNVEGHGRFEVDGKSIGAHRFAYELMVGPVPRGLQVDHLCRVPACVNPFHLEPVTPRENTLRGEGVTANNARKTHCSNGHPFTPDNIYVRKGTAHPQRMCRECARNRLRHIRALRRSARRLARRTVERQDPMTMALSWHDWQAAGPL